MTKHWIIAHDGSNNDYPLGFSCMRCGAVEKLTTPIDLHKYIKRGKEFQKNHSSCKEKSNEARVG